MQRVHPRRLDAAPAAVGLLAGEDPLARRGAAPPRAAAATGEPLVAVQHPVEPLEAPAQVHGGGAGGGRRAGAQLVEVERQRPHRAQRATTVSGTIVCRAQQAKS